MERDLLKLLAQPILVPLRRLIATAIGPEFLRSALNLLVDRSGLIAVALLLGVVGTLGTRRTAAGADRGPTTSRIVGTLSALIAIALGVWLLGHPSGQFDDLFIRWDHLAFAGFAGLAMTSLAGTWRKWGIAAVSLSVLLQYAGILAFGVALTLTAAGVGLLRTRLRSSARATAGAQAALIAVAYGFTFWLRSRSPLEAARVQGLLAFWALRHISLIVSGWRTGPPTLANCAAFIAFYPGAMGWMGAPEVYDEFARRNLARPCTVNHRQAARSLVEGALLGAGGALVPMTLQQVEAATTTVGAWACGIALFVKTALSAMGRWQEVNAAALLYGVRLRANFAGLLSCQNPSELWWAWRGTLTNWLVQHVYAPLGANRRHQSLNILAAFAVSFVWHALGVPFLVVTFQFGHVSAVALWAAVNAAAVIAHVNADRMRWLRAPAMVPHRVRGAVKTLLAWALGSLTPLLLSYQGDAVARLPHVLRLLFGMHAP